MFNSKYYSSTLLTISTLALMSIDDESKVRNVQFEHSDRASIVGHKGILVGGVIRTQVSQGYNRS